MREIQSQLQRFQGRTPATAAEIRAMAGAAWYQDHILLINLDDPAIVLSLMDRGLLEAIGVKLYGERKKK